MGERNPWLDVTAEDYIGHMGSEAVGQLPVLSDLFVRALERFSPRRLLVLGCGMGNGFERIDPAVTRRVTGVEINPAYLDRLRGRFPSPPFELDLACSDVAQYPVPAGAFDLIHAALIFEYVEWRSFVPKILAGVGTGGGVSAILQLPSASAPAVSETPFPSVRVLEPLFRFVDPGALKAAFARLGFLADDESEMPLPQGKAFAVIHFRRG